MQDHRSTAAGSEPPPVTYKNPRRTSPENSITLRHHRQARQVSQRDSPAALPSSKTAAINSPRRNSTDESNDTGVSDPAKWFDRSNQNAMGNVNSFAMDVDPPFYQKDTDSSNEEYKGGIPSQSPVYRFVQSRAPNLRPGMTHSSSADEFRGVIDDLTIENKRLKEELKKYRQMGPDSMRRDKLFEVKVHGLPHKKKRELEATLRDFTTSLEGSSTGASPNRKKIPRSKNIHSSTSKHASSSSGSNSRPVDSAYASMSTDPNSSSMSLPRQNHAARERTNNQAIENYLRDIPEGLWPRPAALTEREKKKLVVKRLEQLFTGKIGVDTKMQPPPIVEDVEMVNARNLATLNKDATREAKIRPRGLVRGASHHHDNASSSNTQSQSQSRSYEDQADSQNNGNGSGSGSGHGSGSGVLNSNNISPQNNNASPSEQRPTRPRDLDPDRQQVPEDNMDYIRHLGLAAPESHTRFSAKDVSPDAEGWVYLNLLCNLAQLHIFNVTPDFIRSAVSEKSAKFQLSPDGRKIRWRGGAEGTRFSSDNSSGANSQRNTSSDETDGSNDLDQRKKQKTNRPGNDAIPPQTSKFSLGQQGSNSSESFHYKPLFVHHQSTSSDEQPSVGGETGSSYGPPEESNLGINSRWGQSGVSTGAAMPQRKRRRDGAIIYYSGAPFCTDLSGDWGDLSPDTYDMTSSDDRGPLSLAIANPPQISRSGSGSSIPFRPLSGPSSYVATMDVDDCDMPDLTSGETDDDIEADFPWSDEEQHASLLNLEASGLGGVSPDDHFVVVVKTHRPKHLNVDSNDSSDEDEDEDSGGEDKCDDSILNRPSAPKSQSYDTSDTKSTTDTIAGKMAVMSTNSPMPMHVVNQRLPVVAIEYVEGKIRRLPPVPLPPPTFYFPSSDSDFDSDDSSVGDEEVESSERSVISKRALVEESFSDDSDLSGNDEEDEESSRHGYIMSNSVSPDQISGVRGGGGAKLPGLPKMTTGSSAATAGGAASGYNSSMEDA
ncbi:frequency clock protein [Xylariaceae sp. FL0016]|nr:frequency clock protein [Xylariaceae sp. FL0016]